MSPLEEGILWHLMGQGQGCCWAPYNAQGSLPTTQDLASNTISAKVEKPWSRPAATRDVSLSTGGGGHGQTTSVPDRPTPRMSLHRPSSETEFLSEPSPLRSSLSISRAWGQREQLGLGVRGQPQTLLLRSPAVCHWQATSHPEDLCRPTSILWFPKSAVILEA